ncbi:MAG: elongation factor P-like protein EfpL [Wohlfahrtiimonas sp.]
MKANEVKKHTVLAHNGLYYVVREVEKSAPTARGGNTTYRIQMFSIPDGHKVDLSLRADDDLEAVDLSKRATTFSYMDGEDYVFMDAEDYTQYILSEKIVGDMKGYIIEGVEGYYVSLIDENPIALVPPQSIVLEIVDTAPELKGGSATKRTKPARVSTGIDVQVPDYIENGTKIRVNTETGEFMGRE